MGELATTLGGGWPVGGTIIEGGVIGLASRDAIESENSLRK